MAAFNHDLAADLNGKDLTTEPDLGDGGVDAGPPDMTVSPDMFTPPLSAPVSYTTDTGPSAISMGTVNGDTKPDLVVVTFDPNSGNSVLDVFLGAGDGTFAEKLPTTALPAGSSTLALGDVTGDGVDDAVVTSFDANVYVLVGVGDGTFGAYTAIPVNAMGTVSSARIADIDGDTHPDIVAGDFGDQTGNGFVWVLLNNGTGGFPVLTHTSFSVSTSTDGTAFRLPINLRVGQLDNDAAGLLDVAVLNSTTSQTSLNGSFSVLLNGSTPGAASLTLATEVYPSGQSPADIRIAPITGANHSAIIVANQADNDASVFLANTTAAGAVSYAAATSYTGFANGGGNANPTAVAYADLDGDGFSDILLLGGEGGGYLTIFYGGAGGTFNVAKTGRAGSEHVVAGNGPAGLTVGLFDGNASVDVAVAAQSGNTVNVFLNQR